MSIWSYVFDDEFTQRRDLNKLKEQVGSSARNRGRRTRELKSRVEQLEEEVGELTLLCQGLLAVLREQGTLEDEAMVAAMESIDAADGVIDGKVTRPEDRPQPKPAPKPRAPRARGSRRGR